MPKERCGQEVDMAASLLPGIGARALMVTGDAPRARQMALVAVRGGAGHGPGILDSHRRRVMGKLVDGLTAGGQRQASEKP